MTTITVSAPPDQFARTREAIARFDRYHARWNREFWRVLNEPETRENFDYEAFTFKAFDNCERYRKAVVGEAFYADTQAYNSKATIMGAVLTYPKNSGMTDIPSWIRNISNGQREI